uniref:Uncharacterized protein n=1 Tax=Acrobeloides nanus TaxID=290746 RepID=A0A914BXT0_9BILA
MKLSKRLEKILNFINCANSITKENYFAKNKWSEFLNSLSFSNETESTQSNNNSSNLYCDFCNQEINGPYYLGVEFESLKICKSCVQYYDDHLLVRLGTPQTKVPIDVKSNQELLKFVEFYQNNRQNQVICDECDQIVHSVENRYACMVCDDYDLCEKCENEEKHPQHALLRFVPEGSSQENGNVLMNISNMLSDVHWKNINDRNKSDSNSYINIASNFLDSLCANLNVHENISCDRCETTPIVGIRYKCLGCPDFDLCSDCENKMTHLHHVMLRVVTSKRNIKRRLALEAHKNAIKLEEQYGTHCECDECGEPIEGIRFTCTECDLESNTCDLCYKCEKLGLHSHHQMVRIVSKKIKQIGCTYNELRSCHKTCNELIEKHVKIQEEFNRHLNGSPQKLLRKSENLNNAIQRARSELGVDVENFYNFAFAGHAKAGKSSLINSLRGITKSHLQAAKVGVMECTQDISYYTYPNGKFRNVRLYDIPGSGTMSHRAEDYFSDKRLCAFDCLIILIQNTLGEEEISYALKALEYDQPVAFVRSRCDIDLDSMIKDGELGEINQEIINEEIKIMSKMYKREIEKNAPKLYRIPCYFVSSHSLLNIVNGKKTFFYQENELLEFIMLKSKHSRIIIK